MTPGRQLVAAAPSEWNYLHRQRWPEDRLPYQAAIGRLLSRALDGEQVVTWSETLGPKTVQLLGVPDDDRQSLAYLAPPAVRDKGRPSNANRDLRSTVVGWLMRQDQTWVMSQAPASVHFRLDNVDSMVCALVLAPIMGDLAAALRFRTGEVSRSHTSRSALLDRCKETHEALGLQPPCLDVLLDGALDRESVIEARRALVSGWRSHPPEVDVGESAVALLCAQLARVYYKKARKDGTIEYARVIGERSQPLLDATFRDWACFVTYLGENLAAADGSPIDVPDTRVPDQPPAPVGERVEVARDWWDAVHTFLSTADSDTRVVTRLTPGRAEAERREEALRSTGDRGRTEWGYRDVLPDDLVSRIDQLWGSTVFRPQPSTLVTETRPFSRFAEIVKPTASYWERLLAASWTLCSGEASWLTLDELEAALSGERMKLDRLGAPIQPSLHAELLKIGHEHPWLLERRTIAYTVSARVAETGELRVDSERDEVDPRASAEAFDELRKIIAGALRRWLDRYVDGLLDSTWRNDLAGAAGAYWARYRGRGKAPTLRQALPDVLPAAERWFGADYGALARCVGLEGPVASSPQASARLLPNDLAAIRREVAAHLQRRAKVGNMHEGRLPYELHRLAGAADAVLTHWQAVGTAPPCRAIVSPLTAERVFDTDVETACGYLVEAVQDAVRRRGHDAAADLVAGFAEGDPESQ